MEICSITPIKNKHLSLHTTHRETHTGKRLNSPRDIAFRTDGDAYFTECRSHFYHRRQPTHTLTQSVTHFIPYHPCLKHRETHTGKRLNSPRDIAFRTDGDAYFTDPPLGLAHGEDNVEYVGYAGLYRYR